MFIIQATGHLSKHEQSVRICSSFPIGLILTRKRFQAIMKGATTLSITTFSITILSDEGETNAATTCMRLCICQAVMIAYFGAVFNYSHKSLVQFTLHLNPTRIFLYVYIANCMLSNCLFIHLYFCAIGF